VRVAISAVKATPHRTVVAPILVQMLNIDYSAGTGYSRRARRPRMRSQNSEITAEASAQTASA